MKLNHPWFLRGAGRTAARIARWLLPTLDIKAVSYDPTTDPLHPACDQQSLYLTWHECVAFGLPLRAHSKMLGIASEHRDGELLNQAAETLGWKMVRGSSSRGGVSALKQLLREKDHAINIAPDGPRGPRREMSQGAIFLASRSGLPIVCCAYGFDRAWRLRSWDRCAIPKPYSRVRAVYGPPIEIPKRLDRDGLERYRVLVESVLNQLTCEAESWAESGEQRRQEFDLRPGSVDPRIVDDPDAFAVEPSREVAALLEGFEPATLARAA